MKRRKSKSNEEQVNASYYNDTHLEDTNAIVEPTENKATNKTKLTTLNKPKLIIPMGKKIIVRKKLERLSNPQTTRMMRYINNV